MFVLVLMFEIVKVNDKAEEIINKLAEEMTGTEGETAKEQQTHLYIAMKQRPIGATIFYCKPQTYHVLIQIASSILIVVWAFLRVVFRNFVW